MAGGALGAVGSVVGGITGSDAADSAADAQRDAARRSEESQKWFYEQNRGNLEPYNLFGQAGMNALAYRLGLGGVSPTGQSLSNLTYDQLRAELLPQFTSQQTASTSDRRPNIFEQMGPFAQFIPGAEYEVGRNQSSTRDVIDSAGLEAAIQQRLQQQQAAQAGAQNDPLYGSLLSTYKEYTPFSMADFQVDPGYAFRQQQGEQAIERMAAARGGLNSGRAAKDLAAHNSGLASQEYQNAYGRYNNDYQTGFNSFNTNQNNIYNRLMGVTGVGQNAANALAGVGGNAASQIADTQLQAGNSAAAGAVGQANAWSNALGGVTNSLQGAIARGTNQGTSGYSGTFTPTSGVGGLSSGQGVNGWW